MLSYVGPHFSTVPRNYHLRAVSQIRTDPASAFALCHYRKMLHIDVQQMLKSGPSTIFVGPLQGSNEKSGVGVIGSIIERIFNRRSRSDNSQLAPRLSSPGTAPAFVCNRSAKPVRGHSS